jgi:NTP pyrophosphatase (non-canonical NTP hydrolase)
VSEEHTISAIERALAEVREEIVRAIAKFPTWPTDPLHAVAVVCEEAGELTKATLQAVYERHKSGPNTDRRNGCPVPRQHA